MATEAWIEVAATFVLLAWLGNQLRAQYERGDIYRSISLAGCMASLGVAVYAVWAAVIVSMYGRRITMSPHLQHALHLVGWAAVAIILVTAVLPSIPKARKRLADFRHGRRGLFD